MAETHELTAITVQEPEMRDAQITVTEPKLDSITIGVPALTDIVITISDGGTGIG